MRMSRPGWPPRGSLPSPALVPPPAPNSIAYRRYLRYLPEYRTRRRDEEPRRAQTSGEQRQDDDDDDEDDDEEEGEGEEEVLGEKEKGQGSVGEGGGAPILPDVSVSVSVSALVRQYTDMLQTLTTDSTAPYSVSRSCSSIPTATACCRAAAAANGREEQPEEEQTRKASLDGGGGWAPRLPRYRSLSLPWPSDPWWRWRGEPTLACQGGTSGSCGAGALTPHTSSLSRLDSAASDEGCPGDDVSAGPSPLPSPDYRAAHRLSGLITPFRSLSPASSVGSHLGSIEDLPLVRSMSAGHVLDSFRRSHSADSAVEVDEASSPFVSPLNDDPGVAEDGIEAAEEAQEGGDGAGLGRNFCECVAACDGVNGEAGVEGDEHPVQLRRKSDDTNIVSAARRHGAVNGETLLRRVRGCGVVGCGQRQEAQQGGVLRTPSVVISDHSGDTVSLTVALASSDFSLSHLDGLQHSASSPSLCLPLGDDPASRKVSSCSSCSSVSTVDLSTPLTLTPVPLRASPVPEESSRRISSCSTCSYISNSEDEVEQVLTRPAPPRKPSNWRKVRNIVQWTPFIQTYKKHKYPWVQLAGHQGNFRAGHKQGTILKKLCPAEEKALEAIMKDILRPYVPRYSGVVEGADGEKYLQLEDLLSNYSMPCVMDIKMGVRTYLEDELAKAREKPKLRKDMYEKMIQIDPKAPTEAENRAKAVTKPRYMVWRETISSTATQGFRIEGVRRGVEGTSSKDFKTTRTREQVLACLSSFLQGYPHAVSRYVQQLKSIKVTLEASPFFKAHELIGSSLLFVHNESSALVRMIDFAKTVPLPRDVHITHRSPWSEGTHEDGYLLGLDNLIDLFSTLQKSFSHNTPNGTVSSNKSPPTSTSSSSSISDSSTSPTSSSSSSSFSSKCSSSSTSSSPTISTSPSLASTPSTSSSTPSGPPPPLQPPQLPDAGGGGDEGGGGVTPVEKHHLPLTASSTTTTTTTPATPATPAPAPPSLT